MSKVDDVVRWSADPEAPAGMRELLRAANAAEYGPSATELASMQGRIAVHVVPKPVALLTVRTIVVGLLVVATGAGIVGYVAIKSDPPPVRAPIARVESPPAPPPVAIAPAPPPVPPPPVAPPKPVAHPHAPVVIAPAPPPPEPPAPPKISEVAVLEQARVALRGGDTAHALELAEQHAVLYPDGALSEEREALAIEALAKLRRRDEAAARWSKFASSYPQSNYRARLQRLFDIPK